MSVFTECVDSESSFFIKTCVNAPNCNSGGYMLLGSRKPQILFSYSDNFSAPENMRVFIQSSEVGWIKSCRYVPNADAALSGNCDEFYCDLEGSVDGINNFKIIAYDEVGNRSEHSLTIPMDFTPVEPLKINLTKKFFTSKG